MSGQGKIQSGSQTKCRTGYERTGNPHSFFQRQNVNDKDGLIDDLGIDNRETIRKTARVAKANADRDVEVASAEAANKASEAKVAAELAIAQRNNDLEIRKAELKIGKTQKEQKRMPHMRFRSRPPEKR